MDDIVERLRARQSMRTWSGTGDAPKQAIFADTLCHEAANEIDSLRAQLDEAIKDADRAIEHARSVDAKERAAMAAAIQHALQWMEAAGVGDVPAAQQLRASIGGSLAEVVARRGRVVGA